MRDEVRHAKIGSRKYSLTMEKMLFAEGISREKRTGSSSKNSVNRERIRLIS
jgi:hypothetical protein